MSSEEGPEKIMSHRKKGSDFDRVQINCTILSEIKWAVLELLLIFTMPLFFISSQVFLWTPVSCVILYSMFTE